MSIQLFEHNQTAYNAAVEMLAETGKAAVIHPTGTGKSFIGFKLCEDNPDKTVCWLSPSEYIFKTQLENLADTGGSIPQNIKFFTYAKLMNMSNDEIAEIGASIIVYDEYHRAGAPYWQVGVMRLNNIYPDVPALGLSATNIRYLDNQRDMAEELFDGYVASRMSLGEAVVLNILKPPKYVLSVYSIQQELEKYEKRISEIKKKDIQEKAEEYLGALRRALDKADGIDKVLDKNMEDRTGKYIVFCANYEHMQDIISTKISEWFHFIDENPKIYTLYSGEAGADKSFKEFKEDSDNSHLRLLFCIDALNEGVHIEGISGVILLRPTVSPIIYKQQIGRALSASKSKNPVIFDIVNNIENLYSVDSVREEMSAAVSHYRNLGEERSVVNERFEIIDKVAECRELFDKLEGVLSVDWNTMFEHARTYYNEHGNLEISQSETIIDEHGRQLRLGGWVRQQRVVYNNRAKGVLTELQIAKLSSIGMRWYYINGAYYWNNFISACEQYKKENGDLRVPKHYVFENGVKLGDFIERLRNAKRHNLPYRYLTEENIALLDSMGMIWEVDDYRREQNYRLLEKYYEEHGNIDLPHGYVDEETGVKLFNWLYSLYYAKMHPEAKKKAIITDDDVRRLEALGMVWETPEERDFNDFLRLAGKYYSEYGTLDMPDSTVYEGRWLGHWLKKLKKIYAAGELEEEKISALEGLHIDWDSEKPARWDRSFAAAEKYYKEHGDLNCKTGEKYDGINLNAWLCEQRRAGEGKGRSKLTDERKRKLESIGMKFGHRLKDDRWIQSYETAKAYYQKKGNLSIKVRDGFDGGEVLQRWIKTQIISYQKGELSEERAALMEEIGVDWSYTPIKRTAPVKKSLENRVTD